MSHSPQNKDVSLSPGLYESLVDGTLKKRISQLPNAFETICKELDPANSHIVLSRHVADILSQELSEQSGESKVQAQTEICNLMIEFLQDKSKGISKSFFEVELPAEQLLAVVSTENDSAISTRSKKHVLRPETPLSTSCLLTGTRIDPSLASQIRKEIDTSDEIDILCSFIKWSGIRVLEEELRTFTSRKNVRLRVITTSYMGATDPKAIEFLQNLPNTEIRISYDTKRTRLHAKAYLFHRHSGFGAAYVGSANLSHFAITDGLEWNVKISQTETLHLWQKAVGTFETYWNDPEFISYSSSDFDRFSAAIKTEKNLGSDSPATFQFDITPYGYQQEILDKLETEREVHNYWRNLVVAATGTGKTVIAALDYRRECERRSKQKKVTRPRLLFIAHREEILKQSLACFRAVLKDQNFGDLFVGINVPSQLDFLFVSIQTWNSRNLTNQFEEDYFDYVVVDEFHHAEAPSYDMLLKYLQPRILLGLTATPERADGMDILHHFGGRICAEIRLPDAINRKLLSPFQYFGISDSVDLSALKWQRGGYIPAELEERYTGNDSRADLIVRSVMEKLTDYRKSRGLGFCISVKHAEYMAGYFSKCGIPAIALTGASSHEIRNAVQKKLISREINYIFTVDLYNEGVDIPELDTILFLRPTESLTIFLQQFGRGLRLHSEKECLTVLDFIGQAHQNFNFEMRFRALMDVPRHRIDEEIEQGCLHLPLGCIIRLERIAQQHILNNIRSAISINKNSLLRSIKSFELDSGQELSLSSYLDYHHMDLDQIYKRSSWAQMCAEAGVRGSFTEPDTAVLSKGLRRISHINSLPQINALLHMLEMSDIEILDYLISNKDAQKRMNIAVCSLFSDMEITEALEGYLRLSNNPVLRDELNTFLEMRRANVEFNSKRVSLPFSCALDLHGSYTLDEILVAFGYDSEKKRRSIRQGVVHLPDLKADAFFVTLNKSEDAYSPTTMYEDYALSETLFHWQSQSTTSETSETGLRYVNHISMGYTPLLFVREDKSKDNISCPYSFLGDLEYVSHSGSSPMSVVWRLKNPIPARILSFAKRMLAA